MIQTCWPYKGKLSKTLSNLWGIQPQKSEDQSSWLKRFASALFSMEGVVVGCHTVIIQQSIMAMRLSIGCLWQALRNGTRLRQTSHTLPISSLVPERETVLQIHLFNHWLTFFILWKGHFLFITWQLFHKSKETYKWFVHFNVLFVLLKKNI